MQARIETRGPNPPEPPAGPARLGFHDLTLNVSATTQVIDLSGQAIPPRSLASLWTLLGESSVLRRVSLGQCEVGADQACLVLDALLRNQGSLTSLNLKKNHLDDGAALKLLGYSPEAKLCKNRLRHLDLRGNRFSAATGKIFARAVLPPPPKEKNAEEEGGAENDRPKSKEGGAEKAGAEQASTSGNGSVSSAGSASKVSATAAAPAKPRKLRGKAKFKSAAWLTAMVAGGPAKCSRFDEFNGVPTEKLIRGEATKQEDLAAVLMSMYIDTFPLLRVKFSLECIFSFLNSPVLHGVFVCLLFSPIRRAHYPQFGQLWPRSGRSVPRRFAPGPTPLHVHHGPRLILER